MCQIHITSELKSPSHMIMMRSECVRRYNKFSTGVVQFTLFIAADMTRVIAFLSTCV